MSNIPNSGKKYNYIFIPNPVIEGLLQESWRSAMAFTVLRMHGVRPNTLITVDYVTALFEEYAPEFANDQWVRRALQLEIFETGERYLNRKQGAPAHYFRMPADHELAKWLGVSVSNCSHTRFEPHHLNSRPVFTMVVHQALIARRPGQYTRQWLAKRLGIGESTLRRWEKLYSQVLAHPMIETIETFTRENIEWLIDKIPKKAKPGPFWISIYLHGQEIARRAFRKHNVVDALRRGFHVELCQRKANFYTVSG